MKLTMYRGDSQIWYISCKQADGTPLDVTTGLLTFTGKTSSRVADVNAAFRKTKTSGITVINGAAGTISVELAPSDTATLYAPSYLKWDLQYVTTGGKVFTLLSGDLLIKADLSASIS